MSDTTPTPTPLNVKLEPRWTLKQQALLNALGYSMRSNTAVHKCAMLAITTRGFTLTHVGGTDIYNCFDTLYENAYVKVLQAHPDNGQYRGEV